MFQLNVIDKRDLPVTYILIFLPRRYTSKYSLAAATFHPHDRKINGTRNVLTIYIGYYRTISCGDLGKLAVLLPILVSHYSDTPYCQRMGMSPLTYCGIKIILKSMGQFILLALLLLWFFFCCNNKMCICGSSEEQSD